jgi:hypothetical protein
MLTADDWALPADFTSLRHKQFSILRFSSSAVLDCSASVPNAEQL